MHHGYYIPENRTDHVQAQIDLIDEVLKWADVKEATSAVDVGCGIGGSSRHIARKYGCKAQGITLSPYQANRGNELAKEQGLESQASFQVRSSSCFLSLYFFTKIFLVVMRSGVLEGMCHSDSSLATRRSSIARFGRNSFSQPFPHAFVHGYRFECTVHTQVADALEMPFDDNSFDLVWSLESGEHMPDKQTFINELFRVAIPGGRIIIVTWCHRDLEEGETSLNRKEEKLLAKINRAYYLPRWCSVQDYVDLLEAKGATDVRQEDWSYIIAPFWKAVIKSSLNLKSVWGLLKSGFSTQRGAYAMFLMLRGFNKGLIKFGLITCTKPKK
jgi:cyclopropane fatty-acyl-phospholipid synthase-like methyltransferase